MDEVLQGIRIIKYFAWERSFFAGIAEARRPPYRPSPLRHPRHARPRAAPRRFCRRFRRFMGRGTMHTSPLWAQRHYVILPEPSRATV
jgi:hypothetical protein